MTVARILKRKGPFAPYLSPDALLVDVIAALEADDIGALVISKDGGQIDGMISERDVVRGLQRLGTEVLSHAVSDLMSRDVITCTKSDPVAGVLAKMHDNRIRHVPVVENSQLAGMVSILDVIDHRLLEVQEEADAMRAYIRSG